jgi:hypothetical protein
MAFDSSNFNGRSDLRSRAKGQQYFVYDAGSDLLATVMAADYFLAEYQPLSVDDIIQVSTLGGSYDLKVVTSAVGGVTVIMAASVQSLSGAGAADTITSITELTSGGADAITLIDGAIGQVKTVLLLVDGGTPVLTPTTLHGAATVTFADAGDSVTLLMGSLGWTVIAQGGLGTGPVVA